MFTRICSAALFSLALAGCGGGSTATAEGNAAVAGQSLPRIACASSEREAFAEVCTLEKEAGADGRLMTVRAPDGGFRRLVMHHDGTIAAADGAEVAVATRGADGMIDVAIGGARYRIPATQAVQP